MSHPNISRHHADWLSLVEVSGPFVSLPVLMRTFPQGLEPRDPVKAKVLRAAYEEWHDNPAAPGKQRAWVMHVLTEILGYPPAQLAEGQALPAGLEATMPELGETLRPDYSLVGPAGSDTAGKAQLLIVSYPLEQALDKPVIGKHWKAAPATRMMELLHSADVPLGLVTNGDDWMLVYAPRGETTGYASWSSPLWLEEAITLRAFHSLLGVRRFFGVAAESALLGILKESASDQQEVTDQLGYQVREAVEVLVQSFDALDKENKRDLLIDVNPRVLYDAALTIMMRLVFLFSAEERGLLQLGKPLYDNNYAVSSLQEQLQQVADLYGEEVLERRYDAWARLLATFRAVHGGIQHQDLLMQAYGGSLFDPDRYPFLEGRKVGSAWRSSAAQPLAVNNRVVLHLLNSLQRLRSKTGIDGVTETRRVSFRALGVEQIGHVYEGLLDHTAVRANEPVVGIKGTRSKDVEIALSKLESLLANGQEELVEFLKEETGRSVSAIRRTLEDNNPLDEHKFLNACGQNDSLLARLRPFAGLIREDTFERPLVVLADSVYVTVSSSRRSTGTHYTPPSLTEPVVHHTLEPLVYQGPTEGWPRDQWKLKSPKQILDLNVCDMAMGSGAFLVQVCRYLAERLTEAWENLEKEHPNEVLITPDGRFSEGGPSERLVPSDSNERVAIARRVIADRCLYGVDINPMAVEMAKLSLWLITVDASRSFTFLDHAFKCGDSLLGITELDQLERFSMRTDGGKQQAFSTLNLRHNIETARKKREALETMSSDTPEQVAAKIALCNEAADAVASLSAAADMLVAVEIKGSNDRAYETEREVSADYLNVHWGEGPLALREYATRHLNGRRCFHWALEYPEVLQNGGFDAFIGNPPFLGGRRISFRLSSELLDYLKRWLAGPAGTTDLCVYFLLRAFRLARHDACIGLILSDIVSQGESRTNGLHALVGKGGTIYRAIKSTDWPGEAGVKIAPLHIRKGSWAGARVLNEGSASNINSFLQDDLTAEPPEPLKSNDGFCYSGHYLMGQGFVINPEKRRQLISARQSNSDVIFPYVRGDDINNEPTQSSGMFAINFSMRERDECEKKYPECFKIIEASVKPERDLVKRKANKDRWWRYAEARPGLELAIEKLNRVIVQPFTAKFLMPTFVDSRSVFAHPLVVIVSPTFRTYATVQSSIHEKWVWQYCSTSLDLFRYTASTVLETYPLPRENPDLEIVGETYYQYRQTLLSTRGDSLNAIYNDFHNPEIQTSDIMQLRELHRALDAAVSAAYCWENLNLAHGFCETRQGIRYTIAESARREVLDRLLALNHLRHSEELDSVAENATSAPVRHGGKKKGKADKLTLDLL